jgi:hypothetical protein
MRPPPVQVSGQRWFLQLEPHKYAVAIWGQEEDGEPIYEIERENIRDEFSGTTGTGLSRS